jgi:tetratricopeptide (TPR) repeat protein
MNADDRQDRPLESGAVANASLENERSLNTLLRAITLAQGQFALILVACNYAQVREQVVQQLIDRCPVPIHKLTLSEAAKTLYTTIQTELDAAHSSQPSVLMVFGLETVLELDQVLIATNLVREELRKNFPFPLVLWVNDHVLYKLDRLAPDLKSWAGNAIIAFEMSLTDLVRSLKNHAERQFNSVLDAGDLRFSPNWVIVPSTNTLRQTELEFALSDLYGSSYLIEPELQANLDFLIGREAHAQGELETARECYERSLAYWQIESERQSAQPVTSPIPHPGSQEREACVLIYLGMWWRSYGVLQRSIYISACQMARDFFQLSLQLFAEVNRQDLVAKFILALAEVLQKLEQWDDLETVAKQALVLHKLYVDPVRQARDHGFLAEVALARSRWTEAQQSAETALRILDETEASIDPDYPPHQILEANLDIARRYHQSWYWLLLARAKQELGLVEQAIAHLEIARTHSYPQDDPQRYIQILQRLRKLYYAQKKYSMAFRLKCWQRSLEQQYGFRAFVGALRLEPQRYLLNTSDPTNPEILLAQEIRASGRQRDVSQLIARLGRSDYKLTVIHGPSGVGKSSIVYAGLVPALRDRVIGDRTSLPIVVNVYTDWLDSLTTSLAQAGEALPENMPVTSARLIQHLQEATQHNRLPVLIFDQFEEFFFVYSTLPQRRPFYEFLRDSLNLPFVKVILSLREDYLHYLLELQRLTQLDIINNDILSKDMRYPLGDFSTNDAKSVIRELTNQAQFYLEADLIDELVRDLAGELGEVRPIELQVVGAQLQAEDITTLEQYRRKGPKDKLVARSLECVVEDCGVENKRIAWAVLILLTTENGTRPMRTRSELELDLLALEMGTEISKLDLVLEVLVGSGLVFVIPETPSNRYQLVHDYLVPYIRQQQTTGLMAQLEQEREQRRQAEERQRQSEEKLQLVLQQLIFLQQQQIKLEEQEKQATEKQLEEARATQAFLGLAFLGVLVLFVIAVITITTHPSF